MKTISRTAMALFLGSGVASAFAYGEPVAQHSFQDGLIAYKHGNYKTALYLFEQAEREGSTRPSLYYNLGVCYYRLGRYRDARLQFSHAAIHKPLAAVSHYNIGLIEQKLTNKRQADYWFRLAANETDDANMRALAERQLPPEPENISASPHASPWIAGVNIAFGYDDNLLDPTKQAGSSKGSSFGNLLAYTSGILAGNYDNGLRLDASGYFVRYPDQAYFNMNLLQAGVTKLQHWERWRTAIGAQLEQDTLSGRDYLRTLSAHANAARELRDGLKLRLRYRYSDISSLNSLYDPLAGSQQQIKIQLEQRDAKSRMHIGYQYEINNRNDLTTTTGFTSYSPTRNMIYVNGEIRIEGPWQLGGAISYRTSHYNNPDTIVGNHNRTIRNDARWLGRVILSRDMGKNLKMLAEYSHADNHSNIAVYSYQRNVYSLGISYLF